MRLKWESGVAQDIAVELNRLNHEVEDCLNGLKRMEDVLLTMAGRGDDEAIEKFVSAGRKLRERAQAYGNAIEKTSRGVERANELFESAERDNIVLTSTLGGSIAPSFPGEGGHSATGASSAAYGSSPSALRFHNLPGFSGQTPGTAWPVIPEIRHAVGLNQLSLHGGVEMLSWFRTLIDNETGF